LAKRTSNPPASPAPARLTTEQNRTGIVKLKRRISDLEALNPASIQDFYIEAEAVANKINSTLIDVFGQNSIEYLNYEISQSSFTISSIYELVAPR
jgi:hypothetical protein